MPYLKNLLPAPSSRFLIHLFYALLIASAAAHMFTTSPSIPGASAANPPVLPGAQVARTKNWPWYISSTDFRLTPTGRQIFEEYSNIVPADVEPHIFHIVSFPTKSVSSLRSISSQGQRRRGDGKTSH